MKTQDKEEKEEQWWQGPAKWIIGLFLILMLIGWYFPYYNMSSNPPPKNIPSLEDIAWIFSNAEIGNGNRTNSIMDAGKFIDPQNPVIRQAATTISTQSCSGSQVCSARALYYFVRDNINYVADPIGMEYIEPPVEVFRTGGADCESGAILLAALNEAVGINARIVLIPGHALIRIFLPDAPRRYRHGDWVYLDWTCSGCDFGELSPEVLAKAVPG